MSALFSGTVYFVQVTFQTPGGDLSFSNADMDTMIEYAHHAVVPISQYAEQYGPNSPAIGPNKLTFTAALSGTSFTQAELEDWVSAIVSGNSLANSDTCIAVPVPQGLSSSGVGGNSGYHDATGAGVPFIIFGVNDQNLVLADPTDQWAMVVSHEIAEMTVDPGAAGPNPEVCDPCCENCTADFYRVYFDIFDNYLGTNQQTPPGGFNYAYYTAAVVKPAGTKECPASEANCSYAPVPQNFYFVNNTSTFGRSAIQDGIFVYQQAFWLFLEGFTPNGVGASLPDLSGPFKPAITGMTISAPAVTYDVGATGADGNAPQRIRFGYEVTFTAGSLSAFPALGTDAPVTLELSATITIQGQQLAFDPLTLFELVGGDDPYFNNIDPPSGTTWYLSDDLRVFTATPTLPGASHTPVPGGPAFTTASSAAAYKYIQELVAHLNRTYGYLQPSYTPSTATDPLDTILPAQAEALTGDSSVTPQTWSGGTPYPNYSFAIARVRLRGPSGGGPAAASNVKVFFRLFTTQTSDTDYIATAGDVPAGFDSITYPSVDTADPSSPLPGTNLAGTVNGSTLPMFATANFDDGPSDYVAGAVNDHTIAIPAGHDYAWAFFGCYMNVYDPANQIGHQEPQYWLRGGTHHCLVAQIAYSDAPIVNADGVRENPQNSDKLAQRNLSITPSGKHGYPATHRVPQTIDIRPSRTPTPASGTVAALERYPDELMVDWGAIPPGSTASLYWPGTSAAAVLALASELYPGHLLRATDANTIEIGISSRVSYVPIPTGSGKGFAGLFTVELPHTVTVGEKFEVLVSRLSTREQDEITPPDVQVSRAADTAQGRLLGWRYVVGVFRISIPVQEDADILPADVNLLSILKWRLGLIEKTDRWHPVLTRYIRYLSARIDGMGGDAAEVPASAKGHQPGAPAHPVPTAGYGHIREYTGKVSGVAYDRFGDFEGFALRTYTGEEHSFTDAEAETEELVYRAWRERFLITVLVDPPHLHRPISIVLRRPPAPARP